jgi:hypothetical protein
MKIEKVAPIIPEKAAKRRYNVPISLWFVEKNQRWINWFMFLPLIFFMEIYLAYEQLVKS